MAFTPKVWKNDKAGGTKINAAALIDLEERLGKYTDSSVAVIKEAPLNVEYPEYGADGTGTAYSDAAFKKAIAALPTGKGGGGVIFAPRRYKLSEQLNFDETHSVRIIGQASLSAGAGTATPPSELLFTQGSSAALISAKSSAGFGLADLAVYHSSGSQTGAVVDLSHGTAATDAAYVSFDRCHLAGEGVHSALGVNLAKAIGMSFRDTYFQNLDVAIKGKSEVGGYSNAVNVDHCIFAGIGTIPILNPGSAWEIHAGTIFENLSGGGAGAINVESGYSCAGLVLSGCWMGDANSTGTWVTWRGEQLNVRGGTFGGGELGIYIPDSTSDGLNISTRFTNITNGIKANFGVGTHGYIIGACTFNNVSGKKVSLDNGATDAGAGFLSK